MSTIEIISWKKLKEMQPYSRQHILRLEKVGAFPRRVRVGPHRVGWVKAEVEAHLQKLTDDR